MSVHDELNTSLRVTLLQTPTDVNNPTEKPVVWGDWEFVSNPSSDMSSQWYISRTKKLRRRVRNLTHINDRGYVDSWECVPLYRLYARKIKPTKA